MSDDKLKPIQVSIQNFQSIDKLDFEVRGFTCVTGKSNIGKSAIVRAVAGAILNVPVGGMVRKGAKFCSVTFRSDDWSFKWEKGGGVSRYFVPFDAEKPLDKVGAGQIDPVAKMGFQSIKLGKAEAHPWYASQFSPIFLLDEVGSTVTDFISEVSRLQVLQDAIQISIRGRKRALDEAKVRAADVAVLREKASKVVGLDGLEKLSKELEQQAESIREYERKILLSESIVRRVERAQEVLAAVEKVSSVKFPKEDPSALLARLRTMQDRHRALVASAQRVIVLKGGDKVKVPDVPTDELDRLSKARRLQSRLDRLAESVKALSGKVKLPEEPPDVQPLGRMVRAQGRLDAGRQGVDAAERQLKEAKARLAAVQAELDKIPTCPTCGRPSGASDGHSHRSQKQKVAHA